MRRPVLQRSIAASTSTRHTILGWARAWTCVVVIAVVNGGRHRAYEPALGELRAHQLSSVTLLALLTPSAVRTERRHPLLTARARPRWERSRRAAP